MHFVMLSTKLGLFVLNVFTHKQLELYGYILSLVATYALVLKHLTPSIYSADKIFITLSHFEKKNAHQGKNIRR